MAKTIEEIQELLATDLFTQGISKKYITINDNKSIQYNAKNSTKRSLLNPEEFVQALTYLKLIFNYNYQPKNISVNESVQMGSETREADIMVYDSNNNKILIVVECKEENINERQFQVAVDQAYSYAHAKSATYVWITSGIKDEYYEIISATPVLKVPIANIPVKDKEVDRFKYTKGVSEPVKGTQKELIQKFKSAHDALWGGGALAPTTAFDELDKLIFCKIWDERWKENKPRTKGEPFDFQIIFYPEDKNDRLNTKAKTELEKRVIALYEEGREKDPEVFKDDIKLDRNKIFTVVQYLQDINLSETDLDAKGAAFQSFMGEFFRGDFGQFFTPNPIVKFIVDALPINKDDKVLDTSCGSGGFLLHALKKVRDEADDIFKEDKGNEWESYWHNFAEKKLFGIEINEQISRVAKMNMIIHDDGHTNVVTNDGLKSNKSIEIENRNLHFQDGTFKIIMTNPPFGSSVKADEVDYYKNYELFEKNLGYRELKERITDDNSKTKWRISQNTEILFLERCYKYLQEGGYLAVVIPDGILTNSTNQYVRDWIIEKYKIIAIASLPQFAFSHVRATVKSSVLFLQKNTDKQVEKFASILDEVRTQVKSFKELTKREKEDKIIELYKEKIFKEITDYEILTIDIEFIGYDTTGKYSDKNELPKLANIIYNFIEEKKIEENDKIKRTKLSDMLGYRLDVSSYQERFNFQSKTYPSVQLSNLVLINPTISFSDLKKTDNISFVPMEVIDEKYGIIAEQRKTPITKTKGFTKFAENDLLWAKITPCMQNGKSAIARNLVNGYGCGSTEFFVIRPKADNILIEYVHFILRDHRILESAKNSFGGSAGQQRVSIDFLRSIIIPLPSIDKQKLIVDLFKKAQVKAQQLEIEAIQTIDQAKKQIEHIIS